jgi:putative tricarboxylic transport membrane protein
MEILFIAIFLGMVLGLMAGMLPGVGNTITMLAMLPIVAHWPAEIIIIFYAVLIQCSNFTSSVSSLNLGVLGDITGEPALRERNHIVTNQLTDSALKYSAIGSIVACIVALTLFSVLLDWFYAMPLMLRSETKFLLLWTVLIATVWWPGNLKITNVVLITVGIILGMIGHHDFFWSIPDVHILTFGITEIYGGVPSLAVLSACLAVPALLKLYHSLAALNNNSVPVLKEHEDNTYKFSWGSSLRGSAIGIVLGIVPMVGTLICSNVAWAVEKIVSRNRSVNQQSLNRLLSAESANNSAAITVLIPLLLLGLAIIPSEMILLSSLETLNWLPGKSSWVYMGLGFYHWLFTALVLACIVSYVFCYIFVIPFSKFFHSHMTSLMWITILLILSSVYYTGWLVDNRLFFMLCFCVFSCIVLMLYKYVEFMPLVAGFLLGDPLLESSRIVYSLYF